MKINKIFPVVTFLFSLVLFTAGFALNVHPGYREPQLIEVASSDRQWTGVAVSDRGRIFVCYPFWSQERGPFAVGEITNGGKVKPYPDRRWNSWNGLPDTAENSFVCVQSVYVDRDNNLWILDPANPRFEGVVPGGAKLLQVDLNTNRVVNKFVFSEDLAPSDSYLNDVRVDPSTRFAYITDSGLGALLVVNLKTGETRRVLDEDRSTRAEDIALKIGDNPWLRPDGSTPRINADGIALSFDGKNLYWQALTGTTLYRIRTSYLRDFSCIAKALEEKVEKVGKTGPSDGLLYGLDGKIYISAFEDYAIKRFDPEKKKLQMVVDDPRISWPDSFSWGPGGFIYFTTSRIHEGENPQGSYKIYKFAPGESLWM